MSLTLKTYQKSALAALKIYLQKARISDPHTAFIKCVGQHTGAIPLYRHIAGLDKIPYVCLRLPTGGGKTLLAAHSINIAAENYLEQDYPLVLWLVPSNTIRAQTYNALRNPRHPYRQALDDTFNGKVRVFDIAQLEEIQPQDLAQNMCIVIGTLQTFRVENTEGRNIYAHTEKLESHFMGKALNIAGLEQSKDGKPKYSFANLLHLHRPLVLLDEAHNARTKLTFDVLQRLSPACIIELTATPDSDKKTGSNVLYRVSAGELKAEDMIKLPILLTEHSTWEATVRDAIANRQRLASIAKNASSPIRPLLLIQAENADKAVNVEVLKKHLIDNEKIAPECIAIATGNQRELDGVDLFAPNCPINIILTVQALKEGWDCSYAYVFCSVANIRSRKDVEQLLGRVLRMPFATRQAQDDLNRAYAHVCSPCFAQAANELKDTLVSMGFEPEESDAYVSPQRSFLDDSSDDLPLFSSPKPLFAFTASQTPELSHFSPQEREAIQLTPQADGLVKITVHSPLTPVLESKLVAAVPKKEQPHLTAVLQEHRKLIERQKSPFEQGLPLVLPRLCIMEQGELELVEKEKLLELHSWRLQDYPAELPDFVFNEDSKTFAFDMQGEKIVWELLSSQEQLHLDYRQDWTEDELVLWLDKRTYQVDVQQVVLLSFLQRTLTYLQQQRGFSLALLVRARFILQSVLLEKIKHYRQLAAEASFQNLLFATDAPVETSFKFTFDFAKTTYTPSQYYQGSFKPKKHYFTAIGSIDSKEEMDCVMAFERLPQIHYWLRNTTHPQNAFWLPTATDRFYPDFIAMLTDGRLLVLEHKGEHLATNDDSKEKRLIGKKWESASQGKALFLMTEKQDKQGRGVFEQIRMKVQS